MREPSKLELIINLKRGNENEFRENQSADG